MERIAADIRASQARVADAEVGGGRVLTLGDAAISKSVEHASLAPEPLGAVAVFPARYSR
jgi:hypothetical protein